MVVNPPTPACLSGVALDVLGVARACAAVGLSTPAVLLATDAARVERARTARAQRRSWIGGVPGDLDAEPVDGGTTARARRRSGSRSSCPSGARCSSAVTSSSMRHRRSRTGSGSWPTSIGLPVAEIRLARSAHRPGVVVVGVSPVPVLPSTAHLQAIAADLERRAAEHNDRAAA